jgi:Domain of unknown function (DUF397)
MTTQGEDRVHDFTNWRKSSVSNPNGNECVEVASAGRLVGVRDSKNRAAGPLVFGALPWKRFVSRLTVCRAVHCGFSGATTALPRACSGTGSATFGLRACLYPVEAYSDGTPKQLGRPQAVAGAALGTVPTPVASAQAGDRSRT